MARVEGSALVAQAMQREGIEVLFGLAGGPIQDIMGWAPHCGVRPIGVRHEQAATFAAAAYGYVKNQVGVAVLAAGPGVTNGVTGAHVAYDNCLPLLILGGSGPQKGRGTGTFQETENVPMFKGITKMAVRRNPKPALPGFSYGPTRVGTCVPRHQAGPDGVCERHRCPTGACPSGAAAPDRAPGPVPGLRPGSGGRLCPPPADGGAR